MQDAQAVMLLAMRILLARKTHVRKWSISLERAHMLWQVRHFRVVNTGTQAVVCSLAAPLPESSGFALSPGRFTLAPAPSSGSLPSNEATVTLLVSARAFCPVL